MAGVLNNFLGFLKLGDDDYDDDYEEDYEEEKPARMTRRERLELERLQEEKEAAATQAQMKKSLSFEERSAAKEAERISDIKKERTMRMERTNNNKIVPIRTTTRGLEVCIMKPLSFEDSQDICDMLLTGRATVVNLEGFDPNDAQRIMDFISGAVYAINGKLHQISRYIFIFSPEHIDISGDYQELMTDVGFEVPTLNKEF